MEEILCTGPVQDIAALIKACDFPKKAFVLTERLPQHVLSSDKEKHDLLRFIRLEDIDKLGIDVNESTSGRVFYQDFELHWEKDSQGYQVVYLGAERELPDLKPANKQLEGLKKHANAKHYYLFGEILDVGNLTRLGLEEENGYYAEVRIPRLLHYPAPPKAQRVQLVVREYIDETTGQVQLFRFQDLKEGD